MIIDCKICYNSVAIYYVIYNILYYLLHGTQMSHLNEVFGKICTTYPGSYLMGGTVLYNILWHYLFGNRKQCSPSNKIFLIQSYIHQVTIDTSFLLPLRYGSAPNIHHKHHHHPPSSNNSTNNDYPRYNNEYQHQLQQQQHQQQQHPRHNRHPSRELVKALYNQPSSQNRQKNSLKECVFC